jgi:L-arabinokinase
MGGIAHYSGSLVCETTIDRSVAIALKPRSDGQLQIFSFNLFDQHLPFTLNMPIEALARAPVELLRSEFAAPGRNWASHVAGCLYALHAARHVDLTRPDMNGLSIAILNDIPESAAVGATSSLAVATMINLIDHYKLREKLDALAIAGLCQTGESAIAGTVRGVHEFWSAIEGGRGGLVMMRCQPHEPQPPLRLPDGVRIVAIDTGIRPDAEKQGGPGELIRCAAFMGHTMIVDKMRQMGRAAGRVLLSDPLHGYLANLDLDDYKRLFRSFLPPSIRGDAFLSNFGPTIDTATQIDPATDYPILGATDHHVLEASRVRRFTEFLKAASESPDKTRQRGSQLDRAGHLMYASHVSYTNDAKLGSPDLDLLIKLIRTQEPAGIYGARITGPGTGGSVAILCNTSPHADAALAQVIDQYAKETGHGGAALGSEE